MNPLKRPLTKKNPSSNPKTLTTSKIQTALTIAIELYTLNPATAKVKRMATRLSLWETEQSQAARRQREAGRRMRCRGWGIRRFRKRRGVRRHTWQSMSGRECWGRGRCRLGEWSGIEFFWAETLEFMSMDKTPLCARKIAKRESKSLQCVLCWSAESTLQANISAK